MQGKPADADTDAAMAHAQRLLDFLRDDDLDGAIEAGLMAFDAGEAPAGDLAAIAAAQHRLRDAWAARERFRAREVRLAQRDDERRARRLPAPDKAGKPSALPPAAAAALARAKARATPKA